ncbi:Tim44/TimA family putative adaptor protein [Litoreibacter roseus]|uniref:Preprotein translocase subunit Tim44 n=1 Tax=Litoreibacter roseus TaxID=2601869 RepID=A0A6N6JEI4_9RHOB|nr:Tim44/TimA family putative adaptor protein [Litoreibacter roseus]GFE64545.1 preprotein translocase subunit Tim44 [Litoreibacter roseus]
MSNDMIQLLVLAGIAVFLILRLKSVLGTREGFERPTLPLPEKTDRAARNRQNFEVIEGGADQDITDHFDENSDEADALAAMKKSDPEFNVGEFLGGARGAYEMILMAFENGEIDEIRPFLSDDVAEAFMGVINDRKEKGLSVEANFIGVREVQLMDARFDESNSEGELKVKFVGEMTSVVRDEAGDIVEGSLKEIKKSKDIWTFARIMDSEDPNWQLVATGE